MHTLLFTEQRLCANTTSTPPATTETAPVLGEGSDPLANLQLQIAKTEANKAKAEAAGKTAEMITAITMANMRNTMAPLPGAIPPIAPEVVTAGMLNSLKTTVSAPTVAPTAAPATPIAPVVPQAPTVAPIATPASTVLDPVTAAPVVPVTETVNQIPAQVVAQAPVAASASAPASAPAPVTVPATTVSTVSAPVAPSTPVIPTAETAWESAKILNPNLDTPPNKERYIAIYHALSATHQTPGITIADATTKKLLQEVQEQKDNGWIKTIAKSVGIPDSFIAIAEKGWDALGKSSSAMGDTIKNRIGMIADWGSSVLKSFGIDFDLKGFFGGFLGAPTTEAPKAADTATKSTSEAATETAKAEEQSGTIATDEPPVEEGDIAPIGPYIANPQTPSAPTGPYKSQETIDTIPPNFFTILSHESGLAKAKELGFLSKENTENTEKNTSYQGVREATLHAANNIFYTQLGINKQKSPLTITSCCDGKHTANSAHYDGRALDIRSKDESGKSAWEAVQNKCTPQNGWSIGEWKQNPSYTKIEGGFRYNIILENKGTDNEHIHFSITSLAEKAREKHDQSMKINALPIDTKYKEFAPLRNIILLGESPFDLYNGYNRGKAGDASTEKIDFAQKTLDEVIAMQKDRHTKKDTKGIFAVGGYQFASYTPKNGATEYLLEEAKKSLSLAGSEKFTQDLQDTIFVKYILQTKRSSVWKYLYKDGSEEAALDALANEWACFKTKKGSGVHDGDAGGNIATIGYESLQSALQQTKANLQSTKA